MYLKQGYLIGKYVIDITDVSTINRFGTRYVHVFFIAHCINKLSESESLNPPPSVPY